MSTSPLPLQPFITIGFKFCPTDEELVLQHLLNRVRERPSPLPGLIPDFDVYGKTEPWEIWDFFGGATYNDNGFLYVFTTLKKKNPNASKFQRTVGSSGGSWHGEDSGKSFNAGGIRWTQKNFRYENKKDESHDGEWLMQEYSLDMSVFKSPVVVCRIKKNDKNKKRRKLENGDRNKKKRKMEEEEEKGRSNSRSIISVSDVDQAPSPDTVLQRIPDEAYEGEFEDMEEINSLLNFDYTDNLHSFFNDFE